MTTTARILSGTTGIGSLPHHNADAALEFSFEFSIPFLPQIPIRNSWEFMVPQALEGLPGFQVERDGSFYLDPDVWAGRFRSFNERLLNAFARASEPDAFESFEPSAAVSSCWQPFLWEVEERGVKAAKIQIAGPLTCQWSLRLKDQSSVESLPDLPSQIFRLVLARAIAMGRRLRSAGAQPLIFLDEPGLYGLNPAAPRHLLGLQELKLVIQALKKEGFQVGLHCCSNTHWASLLTPDMSLDFLSIDTEHSLSSLLEEKSALEGFVRRGGRLSLGIIPTSSKSETRLDALESASLIKNTRKLLEGSIGKLSEQVMRDALFTPACGLALHTPEEAELVKSLLLGSRSSDEPKHPRSLSTH